MDNHWFKQAKKYLAWEGSLADSGGTVGDESANPGPIDNKPLWKEDGSDIREHMIDEMDYVLVPEEAWDMMVTEFGMEAVHDENSRCAQERPHRLGAAGVVAVRK